jgi:hypothetical protein
LYRVPGNGATGTTRSDKPLYSSKVKGLQVQTITPKIGQWLFSVAPMMDRAY